MWVAFITGGIIVSVIAGIIGRIVFRMGAWRQTIQAAYQPQQAYTTKTPYQVVQASQAARRSLTCCQFLIWLSVLAVVVMVLVLSFGSDTVLAWARQVLRAFGGP